MMRKDQQRRRFRILIAVVILLLLVLAGVALAKSGAIDYLRGRGSTDGGAAEDAYAEAGEDALYYQGKEYQYNDALSNYLFMGVDKTGDIYEEATPGSAGQTDALFLVSYNRKEKTARGLAIPRDTMTAITTYGVTGDKLGEKVDHITLQYAYGSGGRDSAEHTADAVSRMLNGIRIDGYTAFNMDVIPQLTEQLGSVTVTVPDDSLTYKEPGWTKGTEITLDASNTETFVRSRDVRESQTAMMRMERQKIFIRAFVSKLQSMQKTDPHTVTDLYETMQQDLVTNMGNDIYLKLAAAQIENDMETLPGEAVETEQYDEYHLDEQALYDLIIRMFYVEVTK